MPVNSTMERFNQSMKLTILAAYDEGQDPVEEVDKLVARLACIISRTDTNGETQVLSLCIGPSPIQILSGSPAYIETTPLDLVTKRAPCIHYALSLAVYTLGSMSW